MTGYAKLFSSIVHSTIWREKNHVRLVWITMLALSNKDGFVEASLPGLADVSRVTLDECEDALVRLSSPDKYSRSKDFEGRRIETVEGGWILLNYAKYRGELVAAKIREQARIRQQRFRERQSESNTSNADSNDSNAGNADITLDNAGNAHVYGSGSGSAYASDSINKSPYAVNKNPPISPQVDEPSDFADHKKQKAISILTDNHAKHGPTRMDVDKEFDEFYQKYPKKRGKQDALKAYRTARKNGMPPLAELLSLLDVQKKSWDWTKDDGQFIPNPATWIRGGRWSDQLQMKPPRSTKPGEKPQKPFVDISTLPMPD